MRDTNLLFFENDLDAQLRTRQLNVSALVDRIPKDHFLVSTDHQIIEHVVAELDVEPLELDEEKSTLKQNETQVDSTYHRHTFFDDAPTRSVQIPGTEVSICIPFTGDEWIFQYRTNPWSTTFPSGCVRKGYLKITITQPHHADKNDFKKIFQREMKLIRTCLARAKKQVVDYRNALPDLVQEAVRNRRDRLKRHDNIAALLDIPVKSKSDVPTINPVTVEVRRPPALSKPPKSGLVPEPGITDQSLEQILHFIRHQGRTFERTPNTFAVHGEEDLRNIILAQLNGHFQGKASSELFRFKGKTDICIEEQNRAAFVAECKLWRGSRSLQSALDQLMNYLTWRDSKAALIVINVKNKDFTKILDAMPSTLSNHSLFLQSLPSPEEGEWRIQARSAEDEGRRVIVHVFVFNLYTAPNL